MKLSFAATFAFAVGLAFSANAATFSDRASYEAANATTDIVTFEGIAPDGGFVLLGSPFAIGNVSIASSANGVSDGAFFGTPNDTFFVNEFGGAATFTFDAPVLAAGFTLANGFAGGDITASVFSGATLLDSFTFTVPDQSVFTGFFGVNGLGPITSVTLQPLDGGFLLVSEVLSTAAVPEPASWMLMIAGFGLVGGALRRRAVAFAA